MWGGARWTSVAGCNAISTGRAIATLTFVYFPLPPAEQADVERLLIAALGVADFANLRREGLYEESLLT